MEVRDCLSNLALKAPGDGHGSQNAITNNQGKLMSFMNGRFRQGLLAGLTVITFAASSAAAGKTLTAYTSELPPLSLSETEKGIAVEMMEAVAERARIDLNIEFVPWKRAQTIVQNTPGTLIFSIGRSDEREQEYAWIAELFATESGFITTGKPINSFAQAVAEKPTVGVLLGSGRVQVLNENAVTRLDEIVEEEQILSMLNTGRVDAWYTMLWRAAYLLKEEGFDQDTFAFGNPVYVGHQYLAAHRDFDPELARRLAAAIADFRASPEYQKLIKHYTR